MSDESCATCYFCRYIIREASKGTCLRYPPTVLLDANDSCNNTPDVWLSGWCGEYKRNDNQPEREETK